MEIAYESIIKDFVDTYNLPRGIVVGEIEKTFSSMLSIWHQRHVVALFSNNELHAFIYDLTSDQGADQVQINLKSLKGWNTLKKILDKNLEKKATIDTVVKYKRYEKELRWGEIFKINNERLFVEIEIIYGEKIIAECPFGYLLPFERKNIDTGTQKAFHLRRVEGVFIKGVPRVKVTLDRVSKTLVEELLKFNLRKIQKEIPQIKCLKRYVGKKSFVKASAFIPRKVIKQTSQELREHIQVKIVK